MTRTVGADPRFLRSVRLEADWRAADPNRGYILGEAARQALRELLSAAEPGARARAFTLTGPFGTGKSALVLFLADVLAAAGPRRERARRAVAQIGLAAPERPPFLPILATCGREPVARVVNDACREAARENGLPEAADLPGLAAAAELAGYGGVLLVLDEFGKTLEYAARHPRDGDLFALQQIAEFAARSEFPVVVVTVLHQAFAGYADGLDSATRNEWVKVQGRFADVPFLPSEAALAQILAQAIDAEPDDSDRVGRCAREVRRSVGGWPATMDEDAFVRLAVRCWPLHPMALAAIPTLVRRYGQNERSLFALLVERGLLDARPAGDAGVLLADLFEHVSDWIGHGQRAGAAGRRWRLAVELLHSRNGWDEQERNVLRTVALLTALGAHAPFPATKETIAVALPGHDVPRALARLEDKSAIVHRRHFGTYVLWEGSDVDLDGLLERARREVAGRVDVGRALAEVGALRPGLALRHYEETGTLRWFRPVVLTDPEKSVLPDPDEDPANGVFAMAFGAAEAAMERFEAWARSLTREDVVVAVAHRSPQFRELVERLEAIRRVEREAPELRGDRVAREEIAEQRAMLLSRVAEEADRLLDPDGPDGCLYFWNGSEMAVEHRRARSRVFSLACDERFPDSPVLRNELINRRSLSSAAAAARRNLIQAMLERAAEPELGFADRYPPERAIYDSVLKASGLHRRRPDGTWGFAAPIPGDDPCRLGPVWRRLEERIFGGDPAPVRVDELAAELRRPPYGLVDGPFPVLLAAFLAVHRDETAVYREGAYLPEFGIAHWELLLRRPELFAVSGCRLAGARRRALAIVCGRLGIDPPALIPAVRYVVRTVAQLPPRAKSTQGVSEPARTLRRAALEATSPDGFFFRELPQALGLPPLTEADDDGAAEAVVARLRDAIRELLAVVPETRRWARARLAEAAGYPADDEGFAELRRDAPRYRDWVDDPKTRGLCDRLAAPEAETAEVGALSLVAMRPVESWTDSDRDAFPARAAALTREIREERVRRGEVLGPDERRRADELAARWRDVLTADGGDNPAILRAALRRLLRQIEEEPRR